MKKIPAFICICICTIASQMLYGQVTKTVNVASPGTLSGLLTGEEKSTVTRLILTGSVDSLDFRTMFIMPALTSVDLAGATAVGNKIPDEAFYYKEALSEIVLPPAITTIGNEVFEGTGLSIIAIPASVTSIGYRAFASCLSLTGISVDDDNTAYCSIDGILFDEDLKTIITYPPTKAGPYSIPPTVKTIYGSSFSNCTGLTSVNIPASVTGIGTSAFHMCENLASYSVDDASICYRAISGVLFSKDTTTLYLFPPKKETEEYEIPEKVKFIGYGAFLFCINLKNISIPNTVTYIDSHAFTNCSGLTSMVIPSSVETIYNLAFSNCTNLTSIVLPPSMKHIGFNVFYYCSSLRKVTLPSSFETIGSNLFTLCSSIDTIIVNAAVPYELNPLLLYFDESIFATATLMVPAGSKSAYSTAEVWKSFVDIKEFSFSLSADHTSLMVAAAEGSGASFKLTSNTEWKISSNQNWLEVSDTLGINKATVSLVARANSSSSPRQAIVSVTGLGVSRIDITITQSGLVSSTGDIFSAEVIVYPNPVSDFIIVKNAAGLCLQIFTIHGNLLKTGNINTADERIDLTPLSPGLYILKLGTGYFKIVKT